MKLLTSIADAPPRRHALIIVTLVVLSTLLLALLPVFLSEGAIWNLMREHGPVENTSVIFWLLAVVLILALHSYRHVNEWAFAILFAGFAAREADGHKAFTGESMLKDDYYQFSTDPLWAKVLAGVIAILLIAALLYVLIRVFCFLFLEGGWRRGSGLWLGAGFALLFITKALDRSPGILKEDFGIELPFSSVLFLSLEEGLEILMPAFLCLAVVMFWYESRRTALRAPLFRTQ